MSSKQRIGQNKNQVSLLLSISHFTLFTSLVRILFIQSKEGQEMKKINAPILFVIHLHF